MSIVNESKERINQTKLLIKQCDYDISLITDNCISNKNGNNVKINENNNNETVIYNNLNILYNNTIEIMKILDSNITELNNKAIQSDNKLIIELNQHTNNFNYVENSLTTISNNFNKASENAMKIGERLTIADNEKKRLDIAIDLINYINYFENCNININELITLGYQKMKEILPLTLKDKDWGFISYILSELRKILVDINSEQVQKAQLLIQKLSDVLENELLQEFEFTFDCLMNINISNNKQSYQQLEKCRQLVYWLHYYNDGSSIQKRYIFSVVEKRIPSNLTNKSISNVTTWKKMASVMNKIKKNIVYEVTGDTHDNDDDESSPGASDDESDDNSNEDNSNTPNIFDNIKSLIPIDNSSNDQIITNNINDQLSELFGIISSVCQEQFTIIQLIFPLDIKTKITRILIQRIFNDPAFGISYHIDAVLHPKLSKQTLLLSDYLDALLTIREKLTAFYIMLLDYLTTDTTNDLSMNNNINDSNTNNQLIEIDMNDNILIDPNDDNDNSIDKSNNEIKEFLEDQTYSILSIYLTDYFDKEIIYVKQRYSDSLKYNLKESFESSNKNSIIMKALTNNSGNNSKVKSGTLFTVPKLRYEKIKNFGYLINTIVNKKFIELIFTITSDSIERMLVIGKVNSNSTKKDVYISDSADNDQSNNLVNNNTTNDLNRLINKVKEIYLTLLDYLIDGLLSPIVQSSTLILLKISTLKFSNQTTNLTINPSSNLSNNSIYQSSYPPIEYIQVLIVTIYSINRMKTYYKDYIYSIYDGLTSNTTSNLSTNSTNNPNKQILTNLHLINKENQNKKIKYLNKYINESLHAWMICIGNHIDKSLANLQLKTDYNKNIFINEINNSISTISNTISNNTNYISNNFTDSITNNLSNYKFKSNQLEPTTACDSICITLLLVSNTIHNNQNDLTGLHLLDLFWKPLGRQIIGSLISHIRKQKINIDGYKQLIKDLDEYYNVILLFEAPENIDMMLCLKEIAAVYQAEPQDVAKIIIENLRHLDTAIVLSLVKARADFSPKGCAWVKSLNNAFGQIRWDNQLPWELKKNMTIVSFAESAAEGSNSQALGPITLRKLNSSTNKSNMLDINYNDLDSNGVSSSFTPLRPDSMIDNNKILVKLDTTNNETLDFINRNSYSNNNNTTISNKTNNSRSSNVISGSKDKMKSMIDKMNLQVDDFKADVNHKLAIVKDRVIGDNKIVNPFANTATTTVSSNNNNVSSSNASSSSNSSGHTSKLFDKETIKNIFTSPLAKLDNSSSSSNNNSTNNKKVIDKMTSIFKMKS